MKFYNNESKYYSEDNETIGHVQDRRGVGGLRPPCPRDASVEQRMEKQRHKEVGGEMY